MTQTADPTAPVEVPAESGPVVAPGPAQAQLSAVLYKASQCQSRIAEAELTAVMDKERIDVWLADETAGDRATLAQCIGEAEAIQRERLRNLQPGDKKELATPWGVVTAIAKQPEITVTDPAALLEWAKLHTDYIKPPKPAEQEYDWGKIRKAGRAAGTLFAIGASHVPGVTVTPAPKDAPDTLTVKVWE